MSIGDRPTTSGRGSIKAGIAPRRLRLWAVASIVAAIGGTVGAVFAANSVAGREADHAARAFTTSSAEVASTLQLAIQHEEDLIYSASGFLANEPNASSADFVRWGDSVQALQRYPELLGLGQAVLVRGSQFAAYAARTAPDGSFQLIPPGVRPFYCFSQAGLSRTGKPGFPPGYDLCAGPAGVAGLSARDSGKGAYLPLQSGTTTYLAVLTPVYRSGVLPTTVAARRALFVSWVGTQVLPQVVLHRALLGHPGLTVTFTYRTAASKAVFRSGPPAPHARSATTSLHNGWTVRTSGVIDSGGVLSNSTAMTVLIGGVALSALLAALLFVLATGRARALSLVIEKTDELRHLALHDALTGLPNRALILDRIDQLLARNHRNGTDGAALYVDLDGFKNVNDTLGHGAGDRLLQTVAARLTASLRDADTIGRMGGDEFVVLIDGASLTIAPEIIAERLLEVMRQPFELEGVGPVVISASVGIAVGHREAPEQLLHDADLALYQAKGAGKNCYEVFRPEMGTDVQRRYELEFDLRSALAGNQFRLVYQGIYKLADLTLVALEALLRWEHPTVGQIQPDEFIPLLESSGQIIEVGHWVLRTACSQMARWRDEGHDLTVAVNVSGRQLDRDVILDHVGDALKISGLAPAALTIEVTESALIRDIDTTARRLRELKALGVEIAIDDFGTGYSSLAYLQRFPVDCVKIDRTFTSAIATSGESDALFHTLVQLGKDLGLKTLAEGVETTDQVDYLRTQNVDEIQGFLLTKPLDRAACEAQLLNPARSAATR